MTSSSSWLHVPTPCSQPFKNASHTRIYIHEVIARYEIRCCNAPRKIRKWYETERVCLNSKTSPHIALGIVDTRSIIVAAVIVHSMLGGNANLLLALGSWPGGWRFTIIWRTAAWSLFTVTISDYKRFFHRLDSATADNLARNEAAASFHTLA